MQNTPYQMYPMISPYNIHFSQKALMFLLQLQTDVCLFEVARKAAASSDLNIPLFWTPLPNILENIFHKSCPILEYKIRHNLCES